MALSLRGIARRYRNINTGFSIVNQLLRPSNLSGASLRFVLEAMAREEHRSDFRECIYGSTTAFEQIWSHIRVRIRLNPDQGITAATIATLQITWANGIQTTWSHRWAVGHAGEASCPLTFEVQWVNNNEHHVVRVQTVGHTNQGVWHTNDTGAVAAHEFGHMLGNADEYTDTNCPSRDPVNTGTVMDNNSANVPARLMTRFADNIGSIVLAV